jgi:hypothetical protein
MLNFSKPKPCGPRLPPIYRQVARSAAKILLGGKPVDVPIEQPTNFELCC